MPELNGYKVSSRSIKNQKKKRNSLFSEQEPCMKIQIWRGNCNKKNYQRGGNQSSAFSAVCTCPGIPFLGTDKQKTSELKQRVQIFNIKTVIISLHKRVPGSLFQFSRNLHKTI
jgi:hypothetical protein